MPMMIDELKQALGFLTRLPPGKSDRYDESLSGSAVSWFGLVGFLIGLLLLSLTLVFRQFSIPPVVVAALLIMFWAGITGALHLDGLGDCGDAWMGGHDKTRMLEIMKDTSCGVGAIVVIVLVLLIKFAALFVLIDRGEVFAIVFATTLSRIGLAIAIAQFPYLRISGLGSKLHDHLQMPNIMIVGGGLILVLGVISFETMIMSVIGSALGFAIIYAGIVRKINGFTGDVYGALVETSEAFILVVLTQLSFQGL